MQVFVKDLASGSLVLASQSADRVPGEHLSFMPEISADGRAVAFSSIAALLPLDGNVWADVYVRASPTIGTTPPRDPPPPTRRGCKRPRKPRHERAHFPRLGAEPGRLTGSVHASTDPGAQPA